MSAPPPPPPPEGGVTFGDVPVDSVAMERVSTGTVGLDQMLNGGLIKNRPYLVTGGPGAGKTIFSMQFLRDGIRKGENGMYVTLEEPPTELKNNLVSLGWAEEVNRLRILDATPKLRADIWSIPGDGANSASQTIGDWSISEDNAFMPDQNFNLPNLIRAMAIELDTYNHKRVVIDSLTSIRMLFSTETEVRREIITLLDFLATSDCTTMLISENLSPEGIEMEGFYARGIIKLLTLEQGGKKKRCVEITKMRGTSFDDQRRPMMITSNGPVVYADEAVFT